MTKLLLLRALMALTAVSLASCVPSVVGPRSVGGPAATYVSFLSEPPGARVTLNGSELPGRTPILHLAVSPGFVEVQFHREGFKVARVQKSLEPGSATRVDLRLEPLPSPTPTATPTRTPPAPPTPTPARPRVTIETDPPGAQVRVDGVVLPGTTPMLDVVLGPGPHRFELRLDGYEPLELQRHWPRGGRQRLVASFLAAPATVTFTTRPPGATVRVDGVELEGVTPLEAVRLPATDSRVEVLLDGHAAQELRRVWRPGATDYVDLDLDPLPAVVSFGSEPAGARVTVDDRELGRTPLEGRDLRAGAARIVFELDGHETVEIHRTWTAGEEDHVETVLFPIVGAVRIDSDRPWVSLEVDGEPVEVKPGEPIELLRGSHIVRAFRGNEVGEVDLEVTAGEVTQAKLTWRRWRPDVKDFALIEAATVSLGDARYGEDSPPRDVAVKEFWIARTEVTVAQYAACVAAGRCDPAGTGPNCNAGVEGRDDHPVNCVRAVDATRYAAWLGESSGMQQRLPSCDEWERAARVGGRFPWGDDEPGSRCNQCDRQCPFANFRNESVDDGVRTTARVASLQKCRSDAGVFDQVGNVAEWCRDRRGSDGGRRYQVRGGSWGQVGPFLDPAFAVRRDGSDRDPTVGFRLVIPRPNWM